MVQISTTPWSEDLTKRGCIALTDCAFFERLTDQTLFPERSGLQSTVPILGWGRVKWRRSMDELAAVFIGLCSAGIFLAHAIDAYQAESAGPKAPGDSDQ